MISAVCHKIIKIAWSCGYMTKLLRLFVLNTIQNYTWLNGTFKWKQYVSKTALGKTTQVFAFLLWHSITSIQNWTNDSILPSTLRDKLAFQWHRKSSKTTRTFNYTHWNWQRCPGFYSRRHVFALVATGRPLPTLPYVIASDWY